MTGPIRDPKTGRFIARPKTTEKSAVVPMTDELVADGHPPTVAEQIRRGDQFIRDNYSEKPVRPATGYASYPRDPVNSSASRPRPVASIVHDVVPEPRRRVWPRLVVVICMAMAAVVAAIVWAVTHR